jgi:hypothetical protein
MTTSRRAARLLRSLRLGLPAGMLLAAACGEDPLQPEDMLGSYSLVQAQSQPLPTLVSATDSCDTWLSAGDLSLDSYVGGLVFALTLEGELDCTRGGGASVGWFTGPLVGPWELDGTTFTFRTSIPSADSLEELTFEGFVSGSRVEVTIPGREIASVDTLRLTFESAS